MFELKGQELLLVLLIVVFLFGGKKIPELSRSIGQAIREIRKGLMEDLGNDEDTIKKTASKKSSKEE